MTDPMFLPTFDPVDASELALWTEAEFDSNGCPDPRICALAPLDGSHAGALVFLEGRRNLLVLENLTAAAVLITPDLAEKVPNGIAILRVKSPSRAFAAIARRLYPQSLGPQPVAGSGISEAAYIHPSVNVEDNVTVEAGAVIGPNVSIGSGTLIGPNTVIAKSCQIGRNCQIASHVSIRNALIGDRVTLHDGVRVGQDGFGFVPGPEGLEKVPQIGRVIIQNDVEIGANSAIDRGALGDTVIGEGTKIDNLVQIAHNVRIGRHCAIAAHGGISGSVTIGDGVLLGGRVGLADHITVGSGAQIAASSGVMNDVPPGEKWGGAPAKPIKLLFREFATLKALAAGKKKDTKDG